MTLFTKIILFCKEINQEVLTPQVNFINRNQLLDITCHCGVEYKVTYRNVIKGIVHCTERFEAYQKYKSIRSGKIIEPNPIICANKSCNKEFFHKTKKYCSITCSLSIRKTEEYKKNMSNSINEVKIRNKTKLEPIICKVCTIEFKPSQSTVTMCSRKCAQEYSRREEYKEIAQRNGSAGGKISATVQGRRSQNEIYFAEKCETHFGKEHVTTNDPCFDGWDADVIIHKEKLAIAWNGRFHYKQLMKSQSLKQVQARDKIKESIITKKYGYQFYVIKDMGKYDRDFVDQEFEIMLLCLMDMT